MSRTPKHIAALVAAVLCVLQLTAQELNCKVTINSDQIQGTNKSVFETLQKATTEFMNNTRWTDYEYETGERIDCSVFIIVNNYSGSTFDAEIQIQASRPVFNSNYKTPIFFYNDKKLVFSYNEGDPLSFDETYFGNNLTQVLAFYAYLVIGTDCDSFSKLGGTPFFRKAESIVNQAQSTSETGWRAFEDSHNRYALINNILDDVAKPYREFFYTYHRNGMDEMSFGIEKSRAKIAESIPVLKSVYKARPSMIIISEFVECKMDELVQIFSKGTATERKTVYETLSYLAPTMQNRFESLK